MTRRKISILEKMIAFSAILILTLIVGCKDSPVEPDNTEPQTDREALQKLADEDSSLSSFEENYNEEDLMDFLGKTNTHIYPKRVGHKVRLVNRNLTVNFVGDTAYGVLTKTYEGTLFIAASYDSANQGPDTLIQKPFTSQVTRNIIFVKVNHSNRPWLNWRIAAISLPEGGTINDNNNIDITKLTITLPNGEVLEITSPNDYYLTRGHGWWRLIPIVPKNDSVTLKVELFSSYEEDDFVTLTYGAHNGLHRAKRKFELVSSTPFGTGYLKVYQQTFRTNFFPGHFHAVINAFPKQVIFDDAAPVENEMWGVPYFVRNN
jgi:hypothetical protein